MVDCNNVETPAQYTGYNPSTGKSGSDNTGNTGASWVATHNAIAVGDVSKNITRQITGVAAGTYDTDAVNVAQLKEAVKSGGGGGATYTAGDGISIDTTDNNKITQTSQVKNSLQVT